MCNNTLGKIIVNSLLSLFLVILLSACSGLQIKHSSDKTVVTLESSLFSNIYLIQASGGYIMIDAGNHNQEKEILKKFRQLNISPEQIKLIIITHAHGDHYGALAQLQKLTQADVLSHRTAIEYLESGTSRPPVARTRWGAFIAAIHPEHKSEKVKNVVGFDSEFDLGKFGLAGKVIHTPGHTPDSVSVILENGHVFLGDMISGEEGDLSFGKFCEDEETLKNSIIKVSKFNAKTIHLSHSDSISHEALLTFINTFPSSEE